VHWLTEDVIMEFLPPGDEGGMSYCYGCERPGIKSWAAFILEYPSGLYAILDFLSGFEELMKEQSWGHLATSKLSGHHIWLIIFISAVI
jgi:hypothetical protein